MITFDQPIRPMLAERAEAPFDSEEHIFEVKWDGERAICFCGKTTRLQNRSLVDITHRYPEIALESKKPSILDGEIVVMHEGLPNFQKLQLRQKATEPVKIRYLSRELPATYVAFDLLYLDGKDLTSLPLVERKEMLQEMFPSGKNAVLCDFVKGSGISYYEAASSRGIEGIMAKRIDSPYIVGGRSRQWLKIKKRKTANCVVCGLTKGLGNRESSFGALVLGVYEDGKLRYVGKVGTGFSEELLRQLELSASRLQSNCPFDVEPEVRPEVKIWLRPVMVCEVSYQNLTQDSRLRLPVFIRLREDKSPQDCVMPS